MKHVILALSGLFLTVSAAAQTLPFQLTIYGGDIGVKKTLQLSDLGEGKTSINFDFKDAKGKSYNFDLKYKKLPSNRSYPGNLDVTLRDGAGNKLGYLFFAINNVAFLKQMGSFGLLVDVDNSPVDINFSFDDHKKGNLKTRNLGELRFVQDTLISKLGFQMIRPVVIPRVKQGLRSQSYALDSHPYEVNYTLKDIGNGLVQFQYNLLGKSNSKPQLLARVYYNADSLKTLSQAMFAGKYFDKKNGAIKLVFYPTNGQTAPPM